MPLLVGEPFGHQPDVFQDERPSARPRGDRQEEAEELFKKVNAFLPVDS